MVCIYCGSKTQVTNSRLQKRLNHTWRRRECTHCHAVFTTEEAVDLSTSVVVRHPSGVLQPFSRDKLFASILQSVGHRDKAVEDAGALTTTIIAKLAHSSTKPSIEASHVTATALETLRLFDTAAAVQYQAYHQT